jgi:hypothetical protein
MLSQSFGLVPGDELQVVIIPSVTVHMCNGATIMSPTDEERIVHRIPNDFSIADSARAVIVLS